MNQEPEWIEKFDETFPISFFAEQGLFGSGFTEIEFTRWTQEATKRAEFKRHCVESFIKEEKEKAKAELLSKIEEEVKGIKDYTYAEDLFGKLLRKDDVMLILSKYKVNK